MLGLQCGNGLMMFSDLVSGTPECTKHHGFLAVVGQVAALIAVNVYGCFHIPSLMTDSAPLTVIGALPLLL
jgi:hypothetical protein